MPARRLPPVLVPDAESQFALYVATCLGRAGHRVHALSSDRSARVRFSRHCASFHAVLDTDSDERRLERIESVVRRVGSCVVLPVAEAGMAWVAEHATRLPRSATVVDLPDLASLRIASDKAAFAEHMRAHAIAHPETRAVGAGEDPLPAAEGLEFPLLWKPARGSGGRGIVRLGDARALEAFARVPVLESGVIQCEVPGRDWDSSALCRDGEILAAAVQHPLPAGARGFQPSTAIAFAEDDEVLEATARVVKALRWSGVANFDLRRDARDGKVCVIEINPRYWSSMLGSCAAGVHFPHLACLAALGIPFVPPRPRPRRYVQAGTALRMALGKTRGSRPSLTETTLPNLIADPLPFAWGRIGREVAKLAAAGRRQRRR